MLLQLLVCFESFSTEFAWEGSDVADMKPSLVSVQADQILKWFLAIGANDRSIVVYFLVCLEFVHRTFATMIA